jgi:heat shock protein HslJ
MKTKTKLLALSSILAALFATGCTQTTTPTQIARADPAPELGTPVRPDALVNRHWQLASLRIGDQAYDLSNDRQVTLHLDEYGEVTGRAGVDAYYATAWLGSTGALKWASPFATSDFHDTPAEDQAEQRYLSALARCSQARLSPDNQLVLSGGRVELVFVDPANTAAPRYVAR